MICGRCEREFQGPVCSCGWKPTPAKGISAWVIQHCVTPGCSTAIRVRVGHTLSTPICKWCAGTADQATAAPTEQWTAEEINEAKRMANGLANKMSMS